MEGAGKLFEDVEESNYDTALDELQNMRLKYPAYRDDQLLMYMLLLERGEA